MTIMRTLVGRVPRRALVWLVVLAVVGAGAGVAALSLHGHAAAKPSVQIAKAIRRDIVVSVGGVGRIIQARGSGQIAVASGGAASSAATATAPGASAAGGGSAPADAVFPATAGHVASLLVVPGQRVAAGQPLARLDDGGATAAAVAQAQSDLDTAILELRQKETSDPSKGLPPTAAELAAGELAVTSARARLARLLGRPLAADVSAARLDLKRSEADLQTLLGRPTDRAKAIAVARNNVQLAKQRLSRVLAPPSSADVSAADADVDKARADLAALLKQPPSPLPEAITAAEEAVATAKQKLAKLTAPPDPAAVAAAQLDVKNAEVALSQLLRRADPPVTVQEVLAAQLAIDGARLRLQKVLAPPDAADVSAAQLEVDRAVADLAALRQRAPGPSRSAIVAAQKAINAARLKRAKLLQPPAVADVTAARLDVQRAQTDLATLLAGATPASLAAARQAVAAAQAKLAQLLGPPLRADVRSAEADVRRAEADLVVLRERGGPASPIDRELASLKVKAAQVRLAAARSAERLLTVRTPTSGTVIQLLTVRGAPVDASTPIATVADLGHLAVSVDLSEFDAAQVKRGMAAVVRVDALGGRAEPGKVLYVAPTGNDTSGVVTFPVRVSLTRSRGGVKPGMNVSVRIIVAERRKVLQVPLEAVSRDDEDRPVVKVLDASGEESPRRVKLGLSNNKSVEIVKGLRQGEDVVLPETQSQGEE